MSEPEDTLRGLPDVVRSSNRPIVIYQGPPPGALEVATGNSLALLSWLALLTVCVATVLFCLWQVWNPGFDRRQFSPVFAEGRPLGLAKQIEERREINARTDGLTGFLDQLRAATYGGARLSPTHPLISDRDGVDDLRSQWDTMCNNIRDRLYDRRLGQIDARAAEVRRQLAVARDSNERARLDGELRGLQLQRSDQIERRRTDSDPALRCVPAALAPVCSATSEAPWCNPERGRPGEFVDEVS